MAGPYYVKNTGDGSDGSNWTKAYQTLAAAVAVMSAGDICYISSSHVESTSGNVTITSPGTVTAPCRFLSVNDGATPPTAKLAGAQLKTATSSQNYTINGYFYAYGLTIIANDGATSTAASININNASGAGQFTMEDCTFYLKSSNAASRLVFGNADSTQPPVGKLINPTFRFGNTGNFIVPGCITLNIIGGAMHASSSVPVVLLSTTTVRHLSRVLLEGFDASLLTGSSALFGTGGARFVARGCKAGNSNPQFTGTCTEGDQVIIDNCDDGDTHYRMERYSYSGKATADESTYVTSGGASDGETPISWKLVDSGNATLFNPVESPEIPVWIGATGSKTFTVEILHDSATNLQDDEVWLDVAYLGTSGFPVMSHANDRVADVFASAADQAVGAGAGTWTKSMTNPNSQKLHLTVTVNEIGFALVKVCMAKGGSYTLYVNPKVAVA